MSNFNFNKVILGGRLTADPELKQIANGTPVVSFSIAVSRRYQSKDSGQTQTDFFNVTAWRERGETCAKYLSKGKKVSVVGPVSVRAYMNSKGEPAASLEITADDVEFLSPRENIVDDPDDPFSGR